MRACAAPPRGLSQCDVAVDPDFVFILLDLARSLDPTDPHVVAGAISVLCKQPMPASRFSTDEIDQLLAQLQWLLPGLRKRQQQLRALAVRAASDELTAQAVESAAAEGGESMSRDSLDSLGIAVETGAATAEPVRQASHPDGGQEEPTGPKTITHGQVYAIRAFVGGARLPPTISANSRNHA